MERRQKHYWKEVEMTEEGDKNLHSKTSFAAY